jgi:hypothetical protein
MALEFDGTSQYVDCGNASSLNITGNHTLMAWVKIPASTRHERILSKKYVNPPTYKGYFLQLKNSGVIQAEVMNGSAHHYKYGTTVLDDDTWHHLAYTYDTTMDITLYVDGSVEPGTTFGTNPGSVGTHSNPVMIGKVIESGVPLYSKGTIADARIYNRVLSANEIAEIYHHRGADKVWQGLVGRWRLDELPSGTPAPLLLDAMDATTGWGASPGDSISLNTTTYQEGSGAINFIKGTIARIYSWMYKTITSVNVTGQTIKLWIYIKDQTTLNKISFVNVRLYSTYDTAAKWGSILNADLAVGWNLFSKHINDFDDIGTPDITAITTLRVQVYTNNASDTISEGNLIYDFYRAGDYSPSSIIDLSGNGNHGTPYYFPVYQASPHRLRRGVLVS